jgi:hypothetical protein
MQPGESLSSVIASQSLGNLTRAGRLPKPVTLMRNCHLGGPCV